MNYVFSFLADKVLTCNEICVVTCAGNVRGPSKTFYVFPRDCQAHLCPSSVKAKSLMNKSINRYRPGKDIFVLFSPVYQLRLLDFQFNLLYVHINPSNDDPKGNRHFFLIIQSIKSSVW